jgi:hypothetical protein
VTKCAYPDEVSQAQMTQRSVEETQSRQVLQRLPLSSYIKSVPRSVSRNRSLHPSCDQSFDVTMVTQ